jgi:hypothetical protein
MIKLIKLFNHGNAAVTSGTTLQILMVVHWKILCHPTVKQRILLSLFLKEVEPD